MLIQDMRAIGERLLIIRKRKGLTQAEVAERAELSDRTYADIERGTSNMRVKTLLQICEILNITPNDILVDVENDEPCLDGIIQRLTEQPAHNRSVLLQIINLLLSNNEKF